MVKQETRGKKEQEAIRKFLQLVLIPEVLNNREALEEQFSRVIEERNRRADEVESGPVEEARQIAQHLFPYPPAGVLCIDGRLGPAGKYGIPARYASFMRLPGGDIPEFVRDAKTGRQKLLRDSDFANRIGTLLEQSPEASEILDSHLFCAAREGEESKAWKDPNDFGLFADVVRKHQIAEAMVEYVKEYYPEKKIDPIQLSYNPHNGFLYMGLDTNIVAAGESQTFNVPGRPKDHHQLEEALEDLAKNGRLISSKMLSEESLFAQAFEKFAPKSFDLRDDYGSGMNIFWKSMECMEGNLLPELDKRLHTIYPQKEGKEIRTRSILLLASAFSGYLNNQNKFQYGEHVEEVIVVTEREHGPFRTMSFPVFSLDLATVARNTVFAAGIIRINRGAKPKPRVKGNPQDPVAVIVQEIVREDISDSAWREFENLDFTWVYNTNWARISSKGDKEFFGQAKKEHPQLGIALVTALNELRRRMAAFYDHQRESAKHIMEGQIVLLPTITDRNRRTRAVIPFVLNGY